MPSALPLSAAATPSPVRTVVFALTGDVRRNSRAVRQLRALAELGYRIEALTYGPAAEETSRIAEGVRLRVLPRPPGGGPRFFWRNDRLFRAAAQAVPAAVYHASDLFTLPAMAAAARAHRARLVFDSRELYAHLSSLAGRPWVSRFWRGVEKHYIRQADAVLTVNESLADRLAAAYQIPRPVVVYNVPPRQDVVRTDWLRVQTGLPAGTPLILYQGDIKPGRGCDVLLEAMRGVERAALVFLGDGSLRPALEREAQAGGLTDRVRFLRPVPPDELLQATASADVGTIPGEPLSLSLYLSLPNKLFEYLMAGLPVLVTDLPEIRRVVEQFEVGRVVPPGDPVAFGRALQEMIDDEAARARWRANTRRVFETFSWEKASQRFKDVYRNLLPPAA